MIRLRLFPDETHFDFLLKRIVTFIVSSLLLIASVAALSTQGLNLGIDFTGGTMIEIRTPVTPDLSDLRNELNGLELGAVSIQEFGAADDLMIRLPQQQGTREEQDAAVVKVQDFLSGYFESEVDYRRVEFVGPQVGEELKKTALIAIVLSLAGILGYVWVRFEWQFGVASVAALTHDVLLTVGFFSVLQLPFDLATLAAILMVAGYSINDTVVVFDRVRENMPKYRKMPLPDLLNMTVNQTLSRTMMTSITTLLALLALWFFGGEVIQSFVNALLFGVVVGTYSSIFVASPLLVYLKLRVTPEEDTEEVAA